MRNIVSFLYKLTNLRNVIYLALFVFFAINALYVYVSFTTSQYTYKNIDEVPHFKTGLLFGTSKYMQDGSINSFYKNRIDAAVDLYMADKIDKILVSGDNGNKSYNEPEMMSEDLRLRGVQSKDIYLDYAGFRTLDSVLRARDVFGQEKFITISQAFHNERAVFLGRFYDVEVYGYNAKAVGFNMWFRELFARVKMILDLVFAVEPRFGGERVEIK
jgi:SanA protein